MYSDWGDVFYIVCLIYIVLCVGRLHINLFLSGIIIYTWNWTLDGNQSTVVIVLEEILDFKDVSNTSLLWTIAVSNESKLDASDRQNNLQIEEAEKMSN